MTVHAALEKTDANTDGWFSDRFPSCSRRMAADLGALCNWAKESGFDSLDLSHAATADDFRTLNNAGLSLGSVDILEFQHVMSSDPGRRKDVLEKNLKFIKDAAAAGAKKFFTCIIPGEPSQTRRGELPPGGRVLAPLRTRARRRKRRWRSKAGPAGRLVSQFVLHARDGPSTSEGCRPRRGAQLRSLAPRPPAVDPIRFLKEFAEHVKHVHAKDTEVDQDALYQFGTQPATFAQPHRWGEWTWRYTLPGHGLVRWGEIFNVLKQSGYKGAVSVELEDENFNGSEEGEQRTCWRPWHTCARSDPHWLCRDLLLPPLPVRRERRCHELASTSSTPVPSIFPCFISRSDAFVCSSGYVFTRGETRVAAASCSSRLPSSRVFAVTG